MGLASGLADASNGSGSSSLAPQQVTNRMHEHAQARDTNLNVPIVSSHIVCKAAELQSDDFVRHAGFVLSALIR